jgi:hypothetical protein
MAGTGKPSMVAAAAFVVVCGVAVLAPTVAMAQIPFMIPNFNFGPHYRGSSHYSTRHSRHTNEDRSAPAPDKIKERDASDPSANTSAPRQQQTSAPQSRDAAPSGGSDTPASAPSAQPAKGPADDQPAFQPSR